MSVWSRLVNLAVVKLAIGPKGSETEITATAAELNRAGGVAPGATAAGKALVADANKAVSEVHTPALYLGAGAGVRVTADAAHLNLLDSVTGGTAAAGKALVLDANKTIDAIGFASAALAATGNSQGTAAALAAATTAVTAADGAKAVVLPAAAAGMRVTVINTATNAYLPVYPATGAAINGLAANAAFFIGPSGANTFYATSGTQWYAQPISDPNGPVVIRQNVATASCNSGAVLAQATPGRTFVPVYASMACRGGAGTGLTSLQLVNTATTSNVILSVPQAALTQDATTGAWSASAASAKMALPGPSGEGVQIKSNGTLATAASVDAVLIGYYV